MLPHVRPPLHHLSSPQSLSADATLIPAVGPLLPPMLLAALKQHQEQDVLSGICCAVLCRVLQAEKQKSETVNIDLPFLQLPQVTGMFVHS